MRVHALKTWPKFFGAVMSGAKTFEIRRDDRGFEVGDLLRLCEWDPATQEYTGSMMSRQVTYILRDVDGLAPGYCVLGHGSPE